MVSRRLLMGALAIFCVTIAGSAFADLEDGLVAYWSFNDGAATDNSGNGHNGTVMGATPMNGVCGLAMSFDGIDDYIDCGTSSLLDMHDEITVSAWVMLRSYPATGQIGPVASKWKTVSQDQASWRFAVLPTGQPDFKAVNSGGLDGPSVTASTTMDIGAFHHLTSVYGVSNETLEVYVDGELRGTEVGCPGCMYVSDSHVLIGGMKYFDEYFLDGVVDEVRIYDRALSGPEVAELYQQCSPNRVPSLGLSGATVLALLLIIASAMIIRMRAARSSVH